MAQADGLECSLCLEHGLWRKCCGEAFCKHCYTQYSRCPNCNTAVDGMGEPIIAEPEQKTGEELKEEAAANSEGFLMDAAARKSPFAAGMRWMASTLAPPEEWP